MEKRVRIPFCGTINLYVETLTGTCFELRVSPFETVLSVKAKIQRLEGIPISQQHLIWEGTELQDDFCLHDYRIRSNSTVRLVIALRGGPINTRRITVDEPSFLDMADFIDANQEELLEELSISGGRNPSVTDNDSQVTLLVYRNGDQVNFFRVIDRGDGSLTPLSEPFRTSSLSELGEVDDSTKRSKFTKSRLSENRVTASKMKQLQGRMQNLKVKETSSSQDKAPSRLVEVRRRKSDNESRGLVDGGMFEQKNTLLHSANDDESCYLPLRTPLKLDALPVGKPRPPSELRPKVSFNRHDMYLRSYGLLPLQSQAEDTDTLPPEISTPVPSRSTLCDCKRNSLVASNEKPVCSNASCQSVQRGSQTRPFKITEKTSSETLRRSPTVKTTMDSHLPLLRKKTPIIMKNTAGMYDEITHRAGPANKVPIQPGRGSAAVSELQSVNTTYSKLSTKVLNHCGENFYCSLDREANVCSSKPRTPITVDQNAKKCSINSVPNGMGGMLLPPCYSRNSTHCSSALLPPVRPLVIKKKRCYCCGKKTGLATSYTCRCGKNFCATHRYAEVHDCTFDYKSAGRQLLKESNPIVTAPKLPKI